MHGGCEVGVFCAVKREDWSQETRREILIQTTDRLLPTGCYIVISGAKQPTKRLYRSAGINFFWGYNFLIFC